MMMVCDANKVDDVAYSGVVLKGKLAPTPRNASLQTARRRETVFTDLHRQMCLDPLVCTQMPSDSYLLWHDTIA